MLPSTTDAYNALQDYSKTRKSAADIQNDADTKYDISGVTGRVSQLRALTNNLSNSIDAVDPSVTGRTSGSLVTEAQRSALVNREKTPLIGQYTKTSSDLGQSQGDLTQAQSLAAQYAGGLRSDDETSYNRLLQNYTAAQAAEQATEAKRQWEAQQAEQKREFDLDQANKAAAARAAATSGYNLGNGNSSNPTAPTPKDAAWQSVQQYLSQGNQRAESDYAATLASAKRGNAIDQLKVQLYNQNGIGLGSVKQYGGTITSGSASF